MQVMFYMNIQILYEDNHLIAVNKPAGLLTQSDYSGEACVLDEVKWYLKEKYHRPGNVFLGIVHRLDRHVSGALVLARTSKAASRLFEQFKGRQVIKLYCAIVELRQYNPDISSWQYLRNGMRRERDITVICDEKEANTVGELYYRVLHRHGSKALVLVQLITGKKHQIRAQLSSVNLPVCGDIKYGATTKMFDGTICLHSLFLQFMHPTKRNPITITAPFSEMFFREYPIESLMPSVEMAISECSARADL